jgi:murein DD-endopeptidase MepM/ murein hydrolase activator NlpD
MWRALLPLALAAAGTGPPTAPAGSIDPVRPGPVTYELPVSGVVTDPFRPPTTPYGPGNRGLEHATEPGDPVRAAAAGRVTFAGAVAGTLHVTVLHADRARTTYSGLAAVTVDAGDVVGSGQELGTSGAALLWTLRLGEAYLDPAVALAASGAGGVRLVPAREGLGGG